MKKLYLVIYEVTDPFYNKSHEWGVFSTLRKACDYIVEDFEDYAFFDSDIAPKLTKILESNETPQYLSRTSWKPCEEANHWYFEGVHSSKDERGNYVGTTEWSIMISIEQVN